ncbi:hypothetical protein BN8_00519 [Fibrisoma limi BUZ 3]|uniref:Uncharacterized protein n=1 Tax=Fibrisoma limi BUZ 3 TaxID=1185876 RepID=I2GCG5_9BACT|nr:hypothetical protein BN8_00519 [Fibrisoma limi BUZ 3]
MTPTLVGMNRTPGPYQSCRADDPYVRGDVVFDREDKAEPVCISHNVDD